MIDREIKRSLGQMIKGVQVVAATDGSTTRAYTSHWVSQISFDEPIVMASVSPKHDTYPLMVSTERFSVSLLAADQIAEGQYFSYPGRKFRYAAPEYITLDEAGRPIVPNSIAWLHCETFDRIERFDHDLFPRNRRGRHRGPARRAPAAVLGASRLAHHRRSGARAGPVDPRRAAGPSGRARRRRVASPPQAPPGRHRISSPDGPD